MNTGSANALLKLLMDAADKHLNRRFLNVLQCHPARVIAVTGQMATVRLRDCPADGSRDFTVVNRSGEYLLAGDMVWLHHWDGYTNAYIAMKNAGGEGNA